jgi:hypothetical protein
LAIALYLLISLQVLFIFLRYPGINLNEHARVSDMVAGTADKPFVYRALVPLMARGLIVALPPSVTLKLDGSSPDAHFASLLNLAAEKLSWPRDDFLPLAVVSFLAYIAFVGFAFGVRSLCASCFAAPAAFVDAAPIVALLGLPPMFVYANYVYDPATLCLMTWGLVLMLRRQWVPYALVFLLACLNKETAVLLPLVMYLTAAPLLRQERSRYYVPLLGQVVAFAAIQLVLRQMFHANAGAGVEYHLWHNLACLPPWTASALLSAAALIFLLRHEWDHKPAFLKTALWMAVPLVAFCLILGFIDEWRDYYEVYPAAMLLCYYSLARLLGVKVSSHDAQTSETRKQKSQPL